MMNHYKQLLQYIKSAVTRNYSEKSINSILDYISTSKQASVTQIVALCGKMSATALRDPQASLPHFSTIRVGIALCPLAGAPRPQRHLCDERSPVLTPRPQMELLQNFYETTLEALKDAKNDRLWFKTNTKLGKLYFDRGDYAKLQKILKQLHLSCQVSL